MYDVGLHRQPVVFVIDRAGITGDDGASHHGVLDMVLLTKVPGMTVLAPSCYQEVGQMLDDALAITDGPVAIRFPKTPARSVGRRRGRRRACRAAACGRGTDVCLLAVGKMLDGGRGRRRRRSPPRASSATVWDVRCVKPLDPDAGRRRRRAPRGRHRSRTASPTAAPGPPWPPPSPGTPSSDGHRPPAGVGARRARRRYLPHGKPDDILADARPRRRRHRRRGPPGRRSPKTS